MSSHRAGKEEQEKQPSKNDSTTPPTTTNTTTIPAAVIRLRTLLQGKRIVIEDSAWTAEAQVPDRKRKELERDTLHRDLKRKLEQAAAEAERNPSQAQAIRKNHAPDVARLAAVSEAVRGNYVLSDYDKYNRFVQNEKKREERKEQAARAVLDRHVKAMARAKRSQPAGASGAPGAPSPRASVSSTSRQVSAARPKVAQRAVRRRPTSSGPSAGASGKSDHHVAVPIARKRAPLAPKTKPHTTERPANQQPLPEPNSENVSFSNDQSAIDGATSALLELSQTFATAPSTYERPSAASSLGDSQDDRSFDEESLDSSQQQRPANMPPRMAQSRTCHECKSKTMFYQRCSYWFPNGTQCKKPFCRTCLEDKYGGWEQADQKISLTEWHCPSCLGTCQCDTCQRKREQEARASTVVPVRTSARRNPNP